MRFGPSSSSGVCSIFRHCAVQGGWFAACRLILQRNLLEKSCQVYSRCITKPLFLFFHRDTQFFQNSGRRNPVQDFCGSLRQIRLIRCNQRGDIIFSSVAFPPDFIKILWHNEFGSWICASFRGSLEPIIPAFLSHRNFHAEKKIAHLFHFTSYTGKIYQTLFPSGNVESRKGERFSQNPAMFLKFC